MPVEPGPESPAFRTFPAELRLLDQLRSFKDPQSRLAWISRRGSEHPGLPDAQRVEAHRVDGCLSKLWLTGVACSGGWKFESDSDSMIIRGLASLVCEACNGRTSTELLERRPHPPLLSDPVLRSLTKSRRSGLTHLWNRLLSIVESSVNKTPQGPG